jgi:phage-Barnase-EndoU-ColicinE5/D-RelE like nuclease2
MPPTKPPESLAFTSLAALYAQFQALLVGKEFLCPARQIPIVITSHHFFHLVKLQKSWQTEFTIEVEESLIQGVTEGFGEYKIDLSRAERLSWIPEILNEPDEIWEYCEKKTADDIFIREYDKAGSAFRAVLVKREENYLKLITCMPMRRRAALDLQEKATKLWP